MMSYREAIRKLRSTYPWNRFLGRHVRGGSKVFSSVSAHTRCLHLDVEKGERIEGRTYLLSSYEVLSFIRVATLHEEGSKITLGSFAESCRDTLRSDRMDCEGRFLDRKGATIGAQIIWISGIWSAEQELRLMADRVAA